jgi:hypothetical protein
MNPNYHQNMLYSVSHFSFRYMQVYGSGSALFLEAESRSALEGKAGFGSALKSEALD